MNAPPCKGTFDAGVEWAASVDAARWTCAARIIGIVRVASIATASSKCTKS